MLLAWLVWTIIGFCYSLGWNFFFYRILYDVLPLFRSMRVAMRGSMIAYLGLAILAGLGAKRLAEMFAQNRRRLSEAGVFAVIALMLLFGTQRSSFEDHAWRRLSGWRYSAAKGYADARRRRSFAGGRDTLTIATCCVRPIT